MPNNQYTDQALILSEVWLRIINWSLALDTSKDSSAKLQITVLISKTKTDENSSALKRRCFFFLFSFFDLDSFLILYLSFLLLLFISLLVFSSHRTISNEELRIYVAGPVPYSSYHATRLTSESQVIDYGGHLARALYCHTYLRSLKPRYV